MSKHAVVAVVNYHDKILLGKKKQDSPKFLAGEWHIPGENVEDNESDQEALIRGIKEEAKLEITVGKYLGKHTTPTSQKEARWYECFASDSQVVCGSDLGDIKWVPRNEVLSHCGSKVTTLWPENIKKYFI
ncbi:MAG: NUDIX hydrolase [Nanoarchaeota archaeon]